MLPEMKRRALLFATSAIACLGGALYGCSSDDPPPGNNADAGDDVVEAGAPDVAKDTGRPDDAGGCGEAPGLGSNPESQCVGKLGSTTPGGTGKAAGESCTDLADCIPFCCACADGGFVSSVAICRCGKCGTATETCATFAKSNFCQ